MSDSEEKVNCILCNEPTTGSIGASGIKWSCICPTCKKMEDEMLLMQVRTILEINKQCLKHNEILQDLWKDGSSYCETCLEVTSQCCACCGEVRPLFNDDGDMKCRNCIEAYRDCYNGQGGQGAH